MNKIIKILSTNILLLILVTGCGKKNYITCTNYVKNDEQNYILESKYKIYYKDKYVKEIAITENYTSEIDEVMDYIEEYRDLFYSNQSDLYGGYTYNLKKLDNRIIIDILVDSESLDIKEMVKDGYLDKNYTINNKLTVTGAKYFYSSIGAICEEK